MAGTIFSARMEEPIQVMHATHIIGYILSNQTGIQSQMLHGIVEVWLLKPLTQP